MKKIERLQMLIMCLKQMGKISASDLADYIEVSKRTIYRDIDALSQMNIPIVSVEGANGGYQIDESYFMPTVRLSEREVLILRLLLKVSGQLNLPEFKESINTLGLKLKNAYQPSGQAHDKYLEYVTFEVQNIFPDTYLHGVFETILKAFEQHCKLKIQYYSPLKNNIIERKISPFHLFYNEGGWYLDAYCHLREKKRTFRLDRIRDILLLSENISNSLEKQYNDKTLCDPKLLLELDIDKSLFNLIQYDNPMREAKIISENNKVLRIQLITNHFVYFESLAIRNSYQVTIIKPESLVHQLRDKLSAALEKYHKNSLEQ